MKTANLLEADFFSRQCELWNGPDLDGLSSKMSQDCSVLTREEILLPWLEKWLGPSLTYRAMDGETPELRSVRAGSSNGALWMRNGSEFRNGAVVSSLSEILETGPVDPRYFLSPKACAGILRRAEKRGKALPGPLRQALEAVTKTTPATEG
jgi:hypothetical protein